MPGTSSIFRLLRRRRLWTVSVLASAGLWAAVGMMQPADDPQPGAPQPGQPITRIDVVGLRHVAEGYTRALIQTQPGDPYDAVRIAEDVTRLVQSGRFDDARAEPMFEDGRLVIVFRVVERPFVEAVEFSGNRKFKTRDLLSEIELAPGRPMSDFAVRQALTNIERKYKEAGFYYASVEVDRERLNRENVVHFLISEGPRVRIRRIVFEGHQAFSPRRLSRQIESQTYLWLFRTGDFDEDRAERDAAALRNYYKDRGFLDARVGYRTDFAADSADLTLTFIIDEGVQYLVKSITFQGNAVFPSDELAFSIRLHPEGVFDADMLRNDVRALTEKYGHIGYLYTEVQTDWLYAREEGYVDLVIRIAEYDQFRFGRIVIRGNARTRDRVIRRELRFFPEDLYDTTAARQAENRLVETGLFTEAAIEPVGDQPGFRDALVRVQEAHTTTILFGVGVTSNSGLVGSIMIENRNFDLFDTPRNFKELFSGRAYRGAGQIMRIHLEPGTEFMRGRISFREPYLFDKELGLGTSLYLFERTRDEWDERRLGFNVSFDRRFREGMLKDWAAEVALRFESVNIGDTDFLTAREIREDRGSNWLTSVKGTLVRDTTDSRFLPTRGNRLSVAWEQVGALGGDHFFGKLTADLAQHFTLATDVMDRKHVLSLGAGMGQIFGDAPVFERFFAGGIGSIRGFEFRGVSPRAGWREDRVGGDFLLLTSAEYSFPLIGNTVRGVAFTDMGTVEESFGLRSWRASAGLGARIYIKPFGPIPMAFDFAFPIARESEDDRQVFSFSFGTTF